MTGPLLNPARSPSPIEWARQEAAALDAHAERMARSHGPETKGIALCRSRAVALRWLADMAEIATP